MLVRIVAGLVVTAVVVFTALMVHHVHEEPLGGVFSELVPVRFEAGPVVALPEASAELPEIDPGMKVFEKAREFIAVGDLASARDRLRTVVTIYPRSKAAPEARRIVGEMNLDEVLSRANMTNKEVYKVKSGDSYLGIASKHDTNLDMIVYLNRLMNLRSLQPGDELLVMPLNFSLRIDPKRELLSLWDGEVFVKEYRLKAVVGAPGGAQKTTISSKAAVREGRRYPSSTEGYRGASKVLEIERLPLVIAAMPADGKVEGLARGFYLDPAEMEELALLTRVGNQVEIRTSSP